MFEKPELKIASKDLESLRDQNWACLAQYQLDKLILPAITSIAVKIEDNKSIYKKLIDFEGYLRTYISCLQHGGEKPHWFPLMKLTIDTIEFFRVNESYRNQFEKAYEMAISSFLSLVWEAKVES